MIKKLTLGTLVLLAFVYSCKKDEESPVKENVPLIATRVITYPGSSNIDSTYYLYDSQGRYAGYHQNNNQRVDITYSGSSVIYRAYNENTLKFTDTYTLNAQELASQLVRTQTGADNATEKYFYNGSNQLTQSISIYNGNADTTFYSYDGDNVTQLITRFEENATSDTISFEYYTDKVSTLNPANYGAFFVASQSKNLIKKKTARHITRDYTYEFDSQNRVIKETSKNGETVVNNISYKYKD